MRKDVPALAIVVPAYKARFLAAALASIAAQTDKRFRLYVCDDGSPEDLAAIFRAAALPPEGAEFHRFEDNVGGRSVVESWRRAIARSTEPWVWMFSDDDLMEPDCVAAFYRTLEADGPHAFNVYRFDTLLIDEDDAVIRINPPHPAQEAVGNFLYHRLAGQRRTFAPDHIFRRSAFEAAGGFVEFPHALGSDDATWIVCAGEAGFRGIVGPRVAWRESRVNVSAMTRHSYSGKLAGYLEFTTWLLAHPEYRPTLPDGWVTHFDMRRQIMDWFFDRVRHNPFVLGVREVENLASETARRFGINRRTARARLWQAVARGLAERTWRLGRDGLKKIAAPVPASSDKAVAEPS